MGRKRKLRATRDPQPAKPVERATFQPPSKNALLAIVLVIVATLITFAPVKSHPFITLDDPDYVTKNEMIQAGVTGGGIRWAFTTFHAANWHPVTWLSHMIDVDLFGVSPGAHLMMNAFLHALAAAALFAALYTLTGFAGRSVTVALLFALHPLAVQSVAWISERKNVLCALFMFLALWAYARFLKSRSQRDYAMVVVFFALSLLAKPMSVTFPAVLLLIDFWIERRLRIADKIPLFVLSAISSLVTLRAQRAGGAVETLAALPFGTRVQNAIVAYAKYLEKTFWPHDLAIFYPYQRPGGAAVLISLVVLLAISAAAILLRRRYPFLIAGWLWFLGTLVPMIGIVQVGSQSMADRYMYVAIAGIAIALVWLVAELLPQRKVQIAIVAVICAALVVRTWVELRHWRGSKELFSRSLAVAGPAELTHNNLGMAYFEEGDYARGEAEFRKSLAMNPDGLDANVNLANALARQDKAPEAIAAYRKVLEINERMPDIHSNLGVALARQGRMAEAVPHFHRALEIDPDFAPAREILRQLGESPR